ncbi:MAG: AAA family ATPase, partial [Prevotella sp.]|nr:AAA family ATPase [Prevotella sp.]
RGERREEPTPEPTPTLPKGGSGKGGRRQGLQIPLNRGRLTDIRYIRCIVGQCSNLTFTASTEKDNDLLTVSIADPAFTYLRPLLREGMQLNLLDCRRERREEGGAGIANPLKQREADGLKTIIPSLIVIEPDFMVDISSIAACFQPYGHHPLLYTVNRMKPRPNTQATLLGNFAGAALDDIIKSSAGASTSASSYALNNTIRNNFRDKALEFCTCIPFDAKKFMEDAKMQAENLQQTVSQLFGPTAPYSRDKAMLEPSFVCEQLGIQGRVDLMTTDMRLLVEQKSGRNMNIERGEKQNGGHMQLEPHFVQLLLYYGVLQHNFQLGNNQVDIRLLYSKYPPQHGLVVVSFYQKLFHEAIAYRNQIVAWELGMARAGFAAVIDRLTPETLNTKGATDGFYMRYLRPSLEAVTSPLHRLSPLEKAYYTQMMTFIYREQRVEKLGAQEGLNNCTADLWNMPLSEKRETGNIFVGLGVRSEELGVMSEERREYSAPETQTVVCLSIPDQGDDFLPNFRRGDMVYLYAYNDEPDVRKAILHKGVICDLRPDTITVSLNNAQHLVPFARYAIEHSGSDATINAAIRGLHEFACAPQERRDLLLGQRPPRRDTSLTLSQSYNPTYDDLLLRAKQARDFFLLIGPPGTGKTSMAMQYLVKEELTGNASILLTAYTNRAVDEICAMLADNNIDFLRLGNEHSCDPRFKPYLLDSLLGDSPKLADINAQLAAKTIVVATTSMLAAKPFIFNQKHFTLAIVDEASQLLEPNIVPLLATHRNGQCCIDRFILIGDHKQLPAVVQQSELDAAVTDPLLHAIGLRDCRNSLFERLIMSTSASTAQESPFVGLLRRQGRMHPEVAAFPNTMFYAKEQLLPVPLPHQEETTIYPSTPALRSPLTTQRMVFIPSEFCTQPSLSDKVNISEARTVARLLLFVCKHYGQEFNPYKSVGVIVPYRNQIAMIRRELKKLFEECEKEAPHVLPRGGREGEKKPPLGEVWREPGESLLNDVSIDTVERYQGSQRDIIIYSFTVQHPYQLDFLTANSFTDTDGSIIDRKLNVALTRARKQTIVLGNEQVLSGNPIFRALINHCYRLPTEDKERIL